MTDSISQLLFAAGINVPEYAATSGSRLFRVTSRLPSGAEVVFVLDKSNDLVHQLARGIVDVAITGADYVLNLQLASRFSAAPGLPWNVHSITTAHRRLRHLGFYGTQFAAMVKSSRSYQSLDEFIAENDHIVCFSEFPLIAAAHLMEAPAYRWRFGSLSPLFVSRGTCTGENRAVAVVRSEGSTESKAVARPGDLIIELVLSSRTARANGLQIIETFGERIFTGLYQTQDTAPAVESTLRELVECLERTVESDPTKYQVHPR